jgi:hypothetical protein
VIEGALKYLESKQGADGSWSWQGDKNKAAITGYAVMAFLSTGNTPGEGPHARAIDRGVKFLLDCVRPDGYIVAPTEISNAKGMYGHGIATIALAEVYGQTKDPAVRDKLQSAIRLIIGTQNNQGGWRYFPRIMDADISVTVLQIVALRAAKNDGIDVPADTINRAVSYVRSCQARDGTGGFAYRPGEGPGFARTAAAIYSLQVCGLYDDPMVAQGSEYLFQQQGQRPEWFVYGNFYAAPAQYMIGGDTWRRWYQDIKSRLMDKVVRDGEMCFWPTMQGDNSAKDENYITAVATMILAMPYHYIPLYQR